MAAKSRQLLQSFSDSSIYTNRLKEFAMPESVEYFTMKKVK